MNRLHSLWAIDRGSLDDMVLRSDGRNLMAAADPVEIEAMYAARNANVRTGSVAVVPIVGPLTKGDTLMTLLFGGTSTTRLVAQIDMLAADPAVGSILLDIDSGGGQVSGISRAAAAIRRARDAKPVVAIATGMMASAAAWLGWSAREVVAEADSVIGSQGVFAVHWDTSKAYEAEGIKPTYIASSNAKVGGNDGLPLDDETRAEMQSIVDEANALFKADIAAGRGITVSQVREMYGNGAVFAARDAKKRGMVDRIATVDETIIRLASGKGPMSKGTGAEDGVHPLLAAIADLPADERIAATTQLLTEGKVTADDVRHTLPALMDQASQTAAAQAALALARARAAKR